jgi:hypothetical protein
MPPGGRTEEPLLGAVFDVHAGFAGTCVPRLDPLRKEAGTDEEAATGGTGQAQGSIGSSRLETGAATTDPTMEQGLEAPSPGNRPSNRRGREVGNRRHGV